MTTVVVAVHAVDMEAERTTNFTPGTITELWQHKL